ncbi:TrkH family potassium uptake protein [Haloarculaceae archaeon H-GB2-1]|nr:TrkH family potassium uptake protein [Haloarculaceae archaeon H-GB1-1]MEA5387577.1 TrkH family potassium uptake protein [Haloarculaceae archaeon H-GB11]MEA5409061.1 TrkH family potassium uptake protein [Haloarculaceae archaeon H-GB2-1]
MLGETTVRRGLELRVDWRASVSLVGTVIKYLSGAMALPLLVAAIYGEGLVTFGASIIVTAIVGLGLERLDEDPDLGAREAFLMVGLTWLAVAIMGSIPYLVAGAGTESTLAHPANALFESMSGFTTTGATVMGSIGFERHSHALMFWRQLSQWLGGMGIVVLAVAILPELSVGGAQLMDAEAPGPGIEKLTPRIAETARVLWLAYLGFTVLEFLLLYGLHLAGMAPNMTLYNAITHPLTTMPTGGFSPEARSVEAFAPIVQWVFIPFMVAAGTNFALFWKALNGDPRAIVRDSEFRFYAGVLGALTAITTGLLFSGAGMAAVAEAVGPLVGEGEAALRHAAFQTVSIVTTTGYASMDFNTWSAQSQFVLLFAMFIGGSAGSTGGSIKIVRTMVILKSIRRELFTTVHPEAVRPVRLGGHALDERAIRGIYAFTLLYVLIFFVATALLLVEVARAGGSFSAFEVMSAVAATLGNVGPGFGAVGPMNSYLGFSGPAKLFMVFLMWIGRLEILPVFVLLTRSYWKT